MLTERIELRSGGRMRAATAVRAEESAGGAVFVGFHGSGGTGEQLLGAMAGQLDFFLRHGVAVFPDAYEKLWNDSRRGWNPPSRAGGVDDVEFTRALAREAAARFGADPARLYVYGHSNGSSLVVRLLHEAPAELAGAAVIGAGLPVPDNLLADDRGPAPVPVAILHGTRDRLVPYRGGRNSIYGTGSRGRTESIPETARYFAARNGLPVTPAVDTVAGDGRIEVVRTAYGPGTAHPVHLYTFAGLGHVIPGAGPGNLLLGRNTRAFRTVDALAEVWGLAAQPTSPVS
ncbi:alpha/beta hydrolase family esterase [Gryllotalpicola ginsengisoli]|uniref:alpha/beta hydrolase family esterase n=1 Tax=Gryllotalpicola ginsengisoli TaxID=444608 RepID=UPI0003B5A680|nr:hypothetical protein [Gryllotalpicola ginsengisoli]